MGLDSEKLRELTEDLIERWQDDAKVMTEDDTKANYIEPVLECLGWDKRDNMRRGKTIKVSGSRPDYVLHADGTDYLAVEAKDLRHRLRPKDAVQALQYAMNKNIPWCLLTQGRCYQVYNVFWRFEPPEKLFFETSLTEAKENFGGFVEKISLLSKDSMINRRINTPARTFYRRIRIRRLFSRPPVELIQAIKGQPNYDDLDNEDIIESLKELRYNRLKFDRCPICNAQFAFYKKLKEAGDLPERISILLPRAGKVFRSWEDVEEHMQKQHPEVLHALYLKVDEGNFV